jgi:RNA polymerase sigma-54 factor
MEEIQEAAETGPDEAEQALRIVQSFDPLGVGARNLTECLLIQLEALHLQDTIIAKIIIHNMDDLEKRKYAVIAHKYNLPLPDIMAAVKIIEGLEPKPARNFSSSQTNYIVPDVYLFRTAETYQIVLNDEGLPRLRVSGFYKKLIRQENAYSKEDKQFLLEKMRSAVGLLKSLDQRNRTIYRVTETLLDLQRDFFDHGVQDLKPLTLKDVASALNLHESTVSRVTSNKYISCEHGIFGFRYLFSSALNSGNGNISSTSVKSIIKKIVTEEDAHKPFSDQHIAGMLKQRKK